MLLVSIFSSYMLNLKTPSLLDDCIGFRLKLDHRRQVGLYRIGCPHFGVDNAVKWKPKLFDCPQTSKAVFAVGQAQDSLLSVCTSVYHTLTSIKTIASIVSLLSRFGHIHMVKHFHIKHAPLLIFQCVLLLY